MTKKEQVIGWLKEGFVEGWLNGTRYVFLDHHMKIFYHRYLSPHGWVFSAGHEENFENFTNLKPILRTKEECKCVYGKCVKCISNEFDEKLKETKPTERKKIERLDNPTGGLTHYERKAINDNSGYIEALWDDIENLKSKLLK